MSPIPLTLMGDGYDDKPRRLEVNTNDWCRGERPRVVLLNVVEGGCYNAIVLTPEQARELAALLVVAADPPPNRPLTTGEGAMGTGPE